MLDFHSLKVLVSIKSGGYGAIKEFETKTRGYKGAKVKFFYKSTIKNITVVVVGRWYTRAN